MVVESVAVAAVVVVDVGGSSSCGCVVGGSGSCGCGVGGGGAARPELLLKHGGYEWPKRQLF